MSATLAAWLAWRTPRERRLLAAVAVAAVALGALAVVRAARDDLARAEARVAAGTRALARARRLVARLPAEAGDVSLLARVEQASRDVVGAERLAAMTPTTVDAGDGLREERVAVRLAGASLDETVRLLHALAAAAPPLPADHLVLRKHADDARRFDVTLEVRRLLPPS